LTRIAGPSDASGGRATTGGTSTGGSGGSGGSTGGASASSGGTTGGTTGGSAPATGGASTGGAGGTTGGTTTGGAENGGGGAGGTEDPAAVKCAEAPAISEATLEVQGDTCNFADDFAPYEGCTGGLPDGSSDTVYAYTPAETGVYVARLFTDWNAVITVGPVCGEPGGDYQFCADQEDPGEELFVFLEAGVTYYIVVDGNTSRISGPKCGSFTLTLTLQVDE